MAAMTCCMARGARAGTSHPRRLAHPGGLEWLKPGVNSFGSAPDNRIQLHAGAPAHIGLLTVSISAESSIVQLLAPAGGFPPELTVDGKPAREGPLAVEGAKPSIIAWRGLTLVVLPRGGRFALRIKDANSPTRAAFHGLNWYQPDPRFRVAARWTPFTPPHVEKIPTVIGTTLDLPAPGIAEFTLDGRTLRLEPVMERPRGKDSLLHPARPDQQDDDLRRGPLSPHRPARPWPRSARPVNPGLQSPGESTLRLHPVRHLPASTGAEPAPRCPGGGREAI